MGTASCLCYQNKNMYENQNGNYYIDLMNTTNLQFLKSENNNNYEPKNVYEKSILILGLEDSGKTSLKMRYFEKKFDNYYIPSLNDEINTKLIYVKKKFIITFVVSNNTKFNNIDNYDCIFVIYDITNQRSFLKAKEIVNSLIEKQINKTIFFIGNKIDLKTNFEEEKEKEKIKNIFNNQKIHIFFISVKNNIGISAMMNFFTEIFNYDEE